MKRISKLKIRKIWLNFNSEKNQVTVQFAQQVEGGTNQNALVAAAQGTNFGPGMVTSLLSFKADKALEYFGTTDADYSDQPFEQWPNATAFAEAVGGELAISVIENTKADPNRRTPQAPKNNPQTGEILLHDGSPIYRHTEVAIAAEVKTVLLKHNGTAPADVVIGVAADAFAAAGAGVAEQ